MRAKYDTLFPARVQLFCLDEIVQINQISGDNFDRTPKYIAKIGEYRNMVHTKNIAQN